MTIFDILKDIITNKKGDLNKEPGFKSAWNSFMICRYLSMDKRFIDIAEKMNKMHINLSANQMYRYLLLKIPKQRNSFIRYISKKSKG